MFEKLTAAPPDAILGLTEAFRSDPNPDKINLGVGVYQDDSGVTPILKCVKMAEQKMVDTEKTKGYLGIPGSPDYARHVQNLVFGAAHEIVEQKRAATAHAPGGTGALRVAADFIAKMLPGKKIWACDPTWANHNAVFGAAGLRMEKYPYFDAAANRSAIDQMIEAMHKIPAGDVVLLHACCHNPTGLDPSPEQWKRIGEAIADRGLLPLVDFAYQGFSESLEGDRAGILELARVNREMLIASSFSKNFGLYRERVGALTAVAASAGETDVVMSQIKTCIRANYSNPPAHGGQIVVTILNDPALTALWLEELQAMRERIAQMRVLLVETLKARGVTRDFEFIKHQRGMFSFSGLGREQVERLRADYAIYIVGGGRINVAGITPGNCGRLCEAIAAVL